MPGGPVCFDVQRAIVVRSVLNLRLYCNTGILPVPKTVRTAASTKSIAIVRKQISWREILMQNRVRTCIVMHMTYHDLYRKLHDEPLS